ncbi:MAG TPA: DUF2442 domain-containing protein [Planctomycetota bacterium]|jgi:hypothetical protein|nr:DUF2442 domain-containing protein [Planctomycetota bacterium]
MTPDLVDVVSVRPLGGMRLRLKFDDGASGEVDLARWLPRKGVFRPLFAPAYFRRVRVDRETGTIAWPNDADVDPVVLYHWTTGKPLPRWAGPLDDGCPSCTRRIETARRPRAATASKRRRLPSRSGSNKSRLAR